MEGWIIWIIIAALMIVIEVFSQFVWTFCLAIGAIAGMICALSGAGIAVQTGVMALTSVVAYFTLIPYVRRWYAGMWRGDKREDRTGMEALLGRRAIVTHDIRPGELGRARIDGDYWQVRAPGVDYVICRGEHVAVTAYDSIILTVQPVNN